MKTFNQRLILVLILIFISNTSFAGRCSGGAGCTACTNCSSCKNCSENGGSCSVCSNSLSTETQSTYLESSDSKSKVYNSNSEISTTKESKNSNEWLLWIFGILGGIWLLSKFLK